MSYSNVSPSDFEPGFLNGSDDFNARTPRPHTHLFCCDDIYLALPWKYRCKYAAVIVPAPWNIKLFGYRPDKSVFQ